MQTSNPLIPNLIIDGLTETVDLGLSGEMLNLTADAELAARQVVRSAQAQFGFGEVLKLLEQYPV